MRVEHDTHLYPPVRQPGQLCQNARRTETQPGGTGRIRRAQYQPIRMPGREPPRFGQTVGHSPTQLLFGAQQPIRPSGDRAVFEQKGEASRARTRRRHVYV